MDIIAKIRQEIEPSIEARIKFAGSNETSIHWSSFINYKNKWLEKGS